MVNQICENLEKEQFSLLESLQAKLGHERSRREAAERQNGIIQIKLDDKQEELLATKKELDSLKLKLDTMVPRSVSQASVEAQTVQLVSSIDCQTTPTPVEDQVAQVNFLDDLVEEERLKLKASFDSQVLSVKSRIQDVIQQYRTELEQQKQAYEELQAKYDECRKLM